MHNAAKLCRSCGVNVSQAQRFKDAAGRYVCGPCAGAVRSAARPAPEPESSTFALDAPAVTERPTARCSSCRATMAIDARVCVSCGFNKDTGRPTQAPADPPGMTPRERAAKKTATMVCISCGYDLKGLKAPKCPECGTVNSRHTQKRASDRQQLRSMYVRPLIGAAIGAALTAGIVAMSTASPAAVLVTMAVLAATTIIGFATYVGCCMLFIGFDEPLGVTFARISCVYALYTALASLFALVPAGGLLLWPVKAIVFVGLLVQIMELDFQDAKYVALACLVVHIAMMVVIVAMLEG